MLNLKLKPFFLLIICLSGSFFGCKTLYTAVDVSAFDRKANTSTDISGCYRFENITDPSHQQIGSGFVIVLQHEKNNYFEMLFFKNDVVMKEALLNLKKGEPISSVDKMYDPENEIFYGHFNKTNKIYHFDQNVVSKVIFSTIGVSNRHINLSLQDNSRDLLGIYNFNEVTYGEERRSYSSTMVEVTRTTTLRKGEYLLNFIRVSN